MGLWAFVIRKGYGSVSGRASGLCGNPTYLPLGGGQSIDLGALPHSNCGLVALTSGDMVVLDAGFLMVGLRWLFLYWTAEFQATASALGTLGFSYTWHAKTRKQGSDVTEFCGAIGTGVGDDAWG